MTPPPIRIVQVSDLHLSRDFPLFLMNWEVLAERIAELAPDLVLATGDLGLTDPDREDDLVFARECLDRMGVRYRAIAGNHDIGETPRPAPPATPGHHPVGHKQKPVTAERRQRFIAQFGHDWWSEVLGGWLLLGVNAQLFGSGLPEEDEQRAFIERTLEAYRGSAVLFVTHKTLHCVEQGADEPGWTIPPEESRWIEQRLARFPTKALISGHLHREKRYMHAGIDCVWAPSTAFFASHPRIEKRRGHLRVGGLELTLGAEALTSVRHIDDDRLVNQDARNWFNPGADALTRMTSKPSPFARALASRPAAAAE